MKAKGLHLFTFENKRDAYGFVVRPQHLQTYREYANIYKEEEEERSNRWKEFLESQGVTDNAPAAEESEIASPVAAATRLGDDQGYIGHRKSVGPEEGDEQMEQMEQKEMMHKSPTWSQIRPSLTLIEQWMSARVKKKTFLLIDKGDAERSANGIVHIQEAKPLEDSEDEFYDVERSEMNQEVSSGYGSGTDSAVNMTNQGTQPESPVPWKEELEFLVSGGLPMALRGEIWQAFTGIGRRREEGYYQNLLALETKNVESNEVDGFSSNDVSDVPKKPNVSQSEKWRRQIEKDLPRTFPGHPALDEDGRNALKRLLIAYARHNPSVGYCQAMNFFAGLLLLLMPEENAFWTLITIIDDYFDGYFSEEMIESQVDLLVLEELVRERFPKLFNHLDYLGVEVPWIAGPWFLSIFVNMLPWESVLRIWDVLLFQGNRVMLFRTALALMELYGPALVTTKDAGDAVTLLQSLAGSTFDSSQLVLTACMGYQVINEARLLELRKKHRPSVMAVIEERRKGLHTWRDSQGLASKLYGFICDPRFQKTNSAEVVNGPHEGDGDHMESVDEIFGSLTISHEIDSEPDLKKHVTWLKAELCRLLEDRRSAILRADELEIALMEMVKQDNRRLLSARVEQLEQEVSELRQALKDKQEQEQAMLQVLIRVEQEQKVTEDARMFAEQDAAAQKYASHMLQEKYEEAMTMIAQMEKRAVMAETMLAATLQGQSSQTKAQGPSSPSPRASLDNSNATSNQDTQQESPSRKISLLSRPFGLGWRD
ncbi:rab GTPase-activating protein 1 isoform X1 [Dendrobium catenatum]|uniref:Rab-GAP TBC domain-containing protein n=1 Tax=Dendrobium catenatum TaxID=906689 RepID=A0A2I0V8D2_9ASPA|nr:rab GTPase-activating protein 1 isoform X1 [Dendrobium catenatum]PKU59651.1 hypothetical protein MA16_Dca020849 [Dendrobium catenatum]